MFKIHYLLLLLVLRLGLALDQEELDLIGYPVEYDTPNIRIPIAVQAHLQRNANTEINDEIYNIWSKEQLVENTPNENRKLSEEVIFQLCNEYQLVLKTEQEERIIDCEHLKLIPKSVAEQLERNKRQANADFEGSGEPLQDDSNSEITPDVTTESNSVTEIKATTIKEDTTFTDDINKEEQKAEMKALQDDSNREISPDVTTESNSVTEKTATTIKEDTSSTDDTNKEEQKAAMKVAPTTQPPNENDKIEKMAEETTSKVYASESKDEGRGGKKARKMKKEDMNEHQSNMSIMEPSQESTNEVEEPADKMQQKESIKVETSPAVEPKQVESSKELSKASKDTSILIFLFVAVIVVGVAAFSYNFIKKRRQANITNDLEAGDKINPIKQSLQSLTKTSANQEQGQEMKPLIKPTTNAADATTTDYPQNNGTDDKVQKSE